MVKGTVHAIQCRWLPKGRCVRDVLCVGTSTVACIMSVFFAFVSLISLLMALLSWLPRIVMLVVHFAPCGISFVPGIGIVLRRCSRWWAVSGFVINYLSCKLCCWSFICDQDLSVTTVYRVGLGWPHFDFFIPGHWFSKARRAAGWGPKGRKWG